MIAMLFEVVSALLVVLLAAMGGYAMASDPSWVKLVKVYGTRKHPPTKGIWRSFKYHDRDMDYRIWLSTAKIHVEDNGVWIRHFIPFRLFMSTIYVEYNSMSFVSRGWFFCKWELGHGGMYLEFPNSVCKEIVKCKAAADFDGKIHGET